MLSFFCYLAKYRYFLDWPIREILSLYFFDFLPNRTKVSLFCYSARYQYPYFQVQIDMANTGNRLFYVSVHNVATSTCIHAFCILMSTVQGYIVKRKPTKVSKKTFSFFQVLRVFQSSTCLNQNLASMRELHINISLDYTISLDCPVPVYNIGR